MTTMAKGKLWIVLPINAFLLVTFFGGCGDKEPVGPGGITALAATSADERYPGCSPDGSKMAFVAGKVIPGGLDRDIYVIDVPDS